MPGSSNGSPLSRPIFVSLSKKISFRKFFELVAFQPHPDPPSPWSGFQMRPGILRKTRETFEVVVVAHEMKLVVEDELDAPGMAARALAASGSAASAGSTLNSGPEHVVHGENAAAIPSWNVGTAAYP